MFKTADHVFQRRPQPQWRCSMSWWRVHQDHMKTLFLQPSCRKDKAAILYSQAARACSFPCLPRTTRTWCGVPPTYDTYGTPQSQVFKIYQAMVASHEALSSIFNNIKIRRVVSETGHHTRTIHDAQFTTDRHLPHPTKPVIGILYIHLTATAGSGILMRSRSLRVPHGEGLKVNTC